jgi:membrane associated rhomboid family serine protease
MRVRYRYDSGYRFGPVLTLITINLLLFIIASLFPSLRVSLSLLPIAVLSQPWTVLTSMFIHGGFWHIFANMLTLYFFGSTLYRIVGQGRFLAVYFFGGIIASIFYIVITFLGAISGIGFLGSPYIPVVGASGAIFAVAGGLVMLRPRLPVMIFPIPLPLPLFVAVIGGFLILSFMPSVAWQAHLGGLIVGLIAGYIFRRRVRYSF